MQLQIIEDKENAQFLAMDEDDNLVGEVMYLVRPNYYDIYHTKVELEYEGKGVASKMVRGVLEYIREKNLKVFPRCPYTANFIKKHPEFEGLLV